MIINIDQYYCMSCKNFHDFDTSKQFSTKCPSCKKEMYFVLNMDKDTELKYIPNTQTVTIPQLEARMAGRPEIKCPTCGSYHTNKLTGIERAVSFGVWGFASNKIGKSFECKNCGYKW